MQGHVRPCDFRPGLRNGWGLGLGCRHGLLYCQRGCQRGSIQHTSAWRTRASTLPRDPGYAVRPETRTTKQPRPEQRWLRDATQHLGWDRWHNVFVHRAYGTCLSICPSFWGGGGRQKKLFTSLMFSDWEPGQRVVEQEEHRPVAQKLVTDSLPSNWGECNCFQVGSHAYWRLT